MKKRDVGWYLAGAATGWMVVAAFYCIAIGLWVFAIPLLALAVLCALIARAIRNERQAYLWRKEHAE